MDTAKKLLLIGALCGAIAVTLLAGCEKKGDPISGAEQADKKAGISAPNGTIYLVMRLYWPKTDAPSILPAGAQAPGVRRVSCRLGELRRERGTSIKS